jgi:hypothetical protein
MTEQETESDSEMPTDRDGESGLPSGIPDPESPPDFDDDPHVLPEEDLVYPTFEFPGEDLSQEDGFDCGRELDREEMESWLDSLAGALESHDLAVEGENLRATFGVAPDDVEISFRPDENQRGTLSITLSLDAKVMRYENGNDQPLGARGGRGFIPIEMLTEDRDPGEYRCYNWIDDPTDEAPESPDEAPESPDE